MKPDGPAFLACAGGRYPAGSAGGTSAYSTTRGPVLGCSDAWQLAEFYAWLLGWRVVDRSEKVPGGWALVESPSGDQKLEFQREEPFVPPVWPTVAGQQQMGMHLDIAMDNLGDGPDRRTRFFGCSTTSCHHEAPTPGQSPVNAV